MEDSEYSTENLYKFQQIELRNYLQMKFEQECVYKRIILFEKYKPTFTKTKPRPRRGAIIR